MAWRKCLVRGLVFTALGGVVLAGALYALWTNPAAIRQVVQEQLAARFLRVAVHLGPAHMRLLGGIGIRELRMSRLDGLDHADFLYVPSAVIYHDKEHMLEGKVLIRKVELTRPSFRVVRDRDGKFNLSGILGPIDLSERVPTVVVRNGTLVFEDRAADSASPLIEIHNLNLTLVNDPLPTLQVEGTGETDVLGPVRLRASVPRATLAADFTIELPGVPVGPDLVRRARAFCPEAASQLATLTGKADVHASVQVSESDTQPVRYDVSAHLCNGRCDHPQWPTVFEEIDLEARCRDGVIPEARLTAISGGARLQARLADCRLPADRQELQDVHRLVREMDVSIEHLQTTPAVLARLPDDLQFIREDYSPAGPISVSYTYRQARGDGLAPVKEWLVRPEGMAGEFIDFRYPVSQVRGTIRVDTSRAPLRNISMDLKGLAEGRPVTLTGTIRGEKKTSEVIIDIRGKDILLDDAIFKALPAKAKSAAALFLPQMSRRRGLDVCPMGKADVHASVYRNAGQTALNKRFTIAFKDSALLYDQFPYPLEHVNGVLTIYPDKHWECKDFRGSHAGGELIVDGHSELIPDRLGARLPSGEPGPPPEIVRLLIRGKGLLIDRELESALSPLSGNERRVLQDAWRTLALSGRMNVTAEVVDHPDHPKDIDVNVVVGGCSVKPTFFAYALDDVRAAVRYSQGKVYLRDIHARHGAARLGLGKGLIQLKPGGGYLAWLQEIRGSNVLPDRDLLAALPEGVRKGVKPLRLEQPVALEAALTLDAAPGAGTPVKVWWDGGVKLTNASFHAGVEVQGADGQFSCRGHHDGHQVRGAFGDLVLRRLKVLGQPVTDLHGRLEVLPDTPEVLRIRDLKAEMFGGTVGGEARLDVEPGLRYDVLLEAVGMQLEDFGKHNLGDATGKAQLQGPARVAVHLQGEGADLLGLKGNGRVDVIDGKMGQLPVLLDLVKAFGLRVPDRTAFEEAHLTFGIEGTQLRVQQVDLYGNAISLRGQGTLDLDLNNVNLDFTATPGRFAQLLPTAVDVIPQMISQQFLKIKVRGKLAKGGDLRFDKELVPGVVDLLGGMLGGR
jgi:hypothetical protein